MCCFGLFLIFFEIYEININWYILKKMFNVNIVKGKRNIVLFSVRSINIFYFYIEFIYDYF